jgi:hypothetical protein
VRLYRIQVGGAGDPIESLQMYSDGTEGICKLPVELVPVEVPGCLGVRVSWFPLPRKILDVRNDFSMKRIHTLYCDGKHLLPFEYHGRIYASDSDRVELETFRLSLRNGCNLASCGTGKSLQLTRKRLVIS